MAERARERLAKAEVKKRAESESAKRAAAAGKTRKPIMAWEGAWLLLCCCCRCYVLLLLLLLHLCMI
jgi:hypothetical protein